MAIVKFGHASILVSIGIKYITNPHKTNVKLISGKDCMTESAQSEMEFVQKLYTGSGTRSYYHMIQSFSPDNDLTPDQAHEIGMKMAEHCFPNNQVLVDTHLDKNQLHNHFIINAVNLDGNKMLNMTYQKGIAIKEYSNELCLQYGLTTTEVKSKRSNMPEWKKRLKYILEDALYSSTTLDDYINYLWRKGISVKYNEANKYMTYTDKDGHKCRDNKLFDERFLKENLEMYFDLGGNYSLIVEDYCNYQTPKTGNCTTGLAESILEMIAALPNHTPNFDDGNYYFEDEVLDKIIQKMRAHGIRITKAQLYHARNDIYNAEQNQDQGFDLIMKRRKIMNDFNKILTNGNVPVNSRLMKINGHYANGVHYCVVSHFKDNDLIEDKIEHMINDEFNLSNIYKKSDEDSLPLDMDKEKAL